MSVRLAVAACAATAAAAASPAASASSAAAAPPPNILLLMADQMRWDTLGPARTYGMPLPNLEALAARGAYFRNGYTSTPSCTPARSALLTSLSPWWNGMIGYGDIAQHYAQEWPRSLAEAGWKTAAVGKNHFDWLASNNSGVPHGFQELHLYDGLGNGISNASGNEFDNYDQFFAEQLPGGTDPLATPGSDGIPLDWNSWHGVGPQGYMYDEALHPTAWTARQAVEFLQAQAAGGGSTPSSSSSSSSASSATKPFALKVSFHRPHSPYDPPARLFNSTPASVLPPRRRGDPSDPNAWDSAMYANSPDCGPASGADAWCGAMPAADEEISRRSYFASLRFVDEQIGTVLAALDAAGLTSSTFIFFISDHGDGQGDHYLWRKTYLYEISAHVPFLVSWHDSFPSAVPRGSVVDAVVELRDVGATILDVAGVAPSISPLNGTSIACLLRTPGATGAGCGSPANGGAWREWIDLEHSQIFNRTNWFSGATDGKTKYVFIAPTGQQLLFNLTSDPFEMADLGSDPAYASVVDAWNGRLAAQYDIEERGDEWVGTDAKGNRRLIPRTKSMVYSPHYPSGGDV